MKFCTECGAKLATDDKFCGRCGTSVAAQAKKEPDQDGAAATPPSKPAPAPAPKRPALSDKPAASAKVSALADPQTAGAVDILKRALNNILNFKGRDTPKQYITLFALVWGIGIVVAALLYAEEAVNIQQQLDQSRYDPNRYAVGTYSYEQREALEGRLAATLIKAALFGIIAPLIVTMASAARRMHDAGYTAPWLFIVVPAASMILPIVGSVVVLGGLAILRSQADENAFGKPGQPER